MYFKCVINLLIVFLAIYSNEQSQYKLSALISDVNNEGIAYVNVLLIKAGDSTLVKGTISS